MVRIFTYAKCDTCRKATRFLREAGITFEEIPIREQPPTVSELRAALDAVDGDIRKLFNTSGGDYRAMEIGKKLPTLSAEDALALLASNGNLVKRPLVIGLGQPTTGFREADWSARLAALASAPHAR